MKIQTLEEENFYISNYKLGATYCGLPGVYAYFTDIIVKYDPVTLKMCQYG